MHLRSDEQKNSGLYWTCTETQDLCDTGATLNQLGYQALFSRPGFHYCLSSDHDCEDRSHIY